MPIITDGFRKSEIFGRSDFSQYCDENPKTTPKSEVMENLKVVKFAIYKRNMQ